MSQRPTDTQPLRAAAAHRHGHDERGQYGAHAGAGGRSVADRAANFRQGAPFLVERATLYDPEPLDPPILIVTRAAPPPRRLLPAALTLLGIVVVVGLAAGVLFVRNADVVRDEEGAGRRELLSDRARTPEAPRQAPGAQPNATTITYDLTRRPNETIVGAWRPVMERDGQTDQSESPSGPSRRRAMPHRSGTAPPDVPPEPVTRPVAVAAPPPRYDAPEPKRRIGDGEPAETALAVPGGKSAAPSDGAPVEGAERPSPSVVARVGRASEPIEAEGPQVEIPLDQLALPRRRPNFAAIEDKEEGPASSAQARRKRLLRLQRQLNRQQRHARKREIDQRQWVPEALYGNRFGGMERLLP
jgi:hypothetical protein